MGLKDVQTQFITQPFDVITGGLGSIFIAASFHVYDVQDPITPIEIGVVALGDGGAIVKSGTICWVNDRQRNFSAVSVSSETAPVVLGQLLAMGLGGNRGMALIGSDIYLVADDDKLDVVNGSNPSSLSFITYNLLASFAITQPFPRSLVSHSSTKRIYILNSSSGVSSRFIVYNATTPAAITQQGAISFGAPTYSQAGSLAINDTTVWYALGGDGGVNNAKFQAINVSNPAAPGVLGSVTTLTDTSETTLLQLSGDGATLYVATAPGVSVPVGTNRIYIYNVSAPAIPVLVTTLTITGLSVNISRIFIRDANVAYLSQAGDGETPARFSIVRLTDGVLLSEQTIPPSAVNDVAITG